MEADTPLPGGPSAAARGRRVLAGLRGRVPPDLLDDARLLVSELVTNSILHGEARSSEDLTLRISTKPDRVRIEVRDAGPGFEPQPPSMRPDQTTGWGLLLVDRVSDRWGVSRAEGCVVWFELDRHRPTSPRSGRLA